MKWWKRWRMVKQWWECYVTWSSDSGVGATSSLCLGLATMRRNIQRWQRNIGGNVGRSGVSPNSYTTFGMMEQGVIIQRNTPPCCHKVVIWCIIADLMRQWVLNISTVFHASLRHRGQWDKQLWQLQYWANTLRLFVIFRYCNSQVPMFIIIQSYNE